MAVRPKLLPSATRAELTDDEAVVSVSGGEQALILNAMANAVLDLCDGQRTLPEIAAIVRDTLHVPADVDVLRDVTALVDQLVRAGVVEARE
jgi:hypothetical protein